MNRYTIPHKNLNLSKFRNADIYAALEHLHQQMICMVHLLIILMQQLRKAVYKERVDSRLLKTTFGS